MATLKEIAEKTKVSITTVSRVLNNDKSLSVSNKIRQKILDTARSMQYKTPRNRMRLKSSKELNVCIVHWYDINQEMDDPYYMQIRMGIEKLAIESNINTDLLYKKNGTYDFPNEFYDGLILVGKFSNDEINRFKEKSDHLVFVDSSPRENEFDSIVIDFKSSVEMILDYIIDKSYKSIGYLGGREVICQSISLGERREQVFREYLNDKNLLNEDHIHVGEFSTESGYMMMKKALENDLADVYFCANDNIAIGAMRAIREKGLKIPDDIGLFGFNDGTNSEFTFPPLSTLHVPTEDMGRQALASIVEMVEGRNIHIKKVLPTKLVIRQSIK
jgi:LacI family transcriptional regulator